MILFRKVGLGSGEKWRTNFAALQPVVTADKAARRSAIRSRLLATILFWRPQTFSKILNSDFAISNFLVICLFRRACERNTIKKSFSCALEYTA
jgi:hypothetical protein